MDSSIALFVFFLALFAGVFILLGYLGYRKTKTAKDYFIAGGKMGAALIAFSYGATFISAVALIGFSGIASLYGYSLLWLAFLNIFVGIFIAFVFYGLRTRRLGLKLGAFTLPELIGKRFSSPKLQAFSGAIIAVFTVLYTAAVFLAVACTIEVIFGIPYAFSVIVFTVIVGIYLIVGGMYATMWSHAVQGIVMLVAMIILTISIYAMCGGLVQAHEAAGTLTTIPAENNITINLTAYAPNGLTSPPSFMSKSFMMVLTLIFGVGIGVLAQPQLIVRYLTAKDEKALKKAVPYGGLFILLMTFTAFSIGPLCSWLMVNNNILFPLKPTGLPNPDKVLPVVITELFPTWFIFLFLFAILAAAMSTASALFHTAGASVGRDIYGAGKKEINEQKSIFVTRAATCCIVVATLFLSLSPPDVVAFMCAFFFSLMGGTFLAIYTLMLYWKKITRAGAWAGILTGFLISMFWYLLVYFKTVSTIFGRVLVENYIINMLDPLFIALPVSFIAAIVVSKLSKQTADEKKFADDIFDVMKKGS